MTTQTKTVTESIVHSEEQQKLLDKKGGNQRVGIFGGTFNPPHYAHLVIAEQMREELELDRIHFMPTAQPAHASGKTTIDSNLRVDMLDLAIQDNPYFSLDLTEVTRGGKSYTIDTILAFKEANPDTEYYFIIGQDMVLDLPNWHRIDELVDLVQFVAARRPGYVGDSQYPILWVDVPEYEISSSDIRQRVRDNKSIRYLTHESVIQYIETKGLYQDD